MAKLPGERRKDLSSYYSLIFCLIWFQTRSFTAWGWLAPKASAFASNKIFFFFSFLQQHVLPHYWKSIWFPEWLHNGPSKTNIKCILSECVRGRDKFLTGVNVKVKATQSFPTLWNPMVYTVHGILLGSLSIL